MKNLLIIGGAGFIGSSLVHKLAEKESFSIYVVEPERANIDRLSDLKDKITMLRTDIKNLVEIHNCLKEKQIDTIIHLASTLIPSSTLYAYQNELTDMIIPTYNIIKMASELKVKFVYFSSGGTIYGNKDTGIFKETDTLSPISYYGLSKLMVEQAILFEKRTSGLQYLILRPSNPYGPGQNLYSRQGLIAVSLGKILNNEPIEVYGDGTIIRDYIFIDDLSEIVFRLLTKGVEGQILNIGSGVGHSINEVIECLKCFFPDKAVNVLFKEARRSDVSAMILDTQKLFMFSPYTPLPLKEGIEKFITYIKK